MAAVDDDYYAGDEDVEALRCVCQCWCSLLVLVLVLVLVWRGFPPSWWEGVERRENVRRRRARRRGLPAEAPNSSRSAARGPRGPCQAKRPSVRQPSCHPPRLCVLSCWGCEGGGEARGDSRGQGGILHLGFGNVLEQVPRREWCPVWCAARAAATLGLGGRGGLGTDGSAPKCYEVTGRPGLWLWDLSRPWGY